MHFLSSGKCKKVFEMLYRRVYNGGDKFSFFEDGLSLIREVLNEKNEAAIIFMDYDLYKGFTDVIYDILKSKNLKIPIILIGDPKRKTTERMNFWVAVNEFQYDIQTLHLMTTLFKKITEALECSEIKKLIFETDNTGENSVLELSPPVKTVKKNVLEPFRKDANLPPSIYNLLAFLFKRRCREVSVDEIASYMNINGTDEKSRKNAVYAYIAKLRKCIDCTPRCKLEVLRTRRGYYKLVLR